MFVGKLFIFAAAVEAADVLGSRILRLVGILGHHGLHIFPVALATDVVRQSSHAGVGLKRAARNAEDLLMRRSWLVVDSSLGTSGSASWTDSGEVTHVVGPVNLVGNRVIVVGVDTKLVDKV